MKLILLAAMIAILMMPLTAHAVVTTTNFTYIIGNNYVLDASAGTFEASSSPNASTDLYVHSSVLIDAGSNSQYARVNSFGDGINYDCSHVSFTTTQTGNFIDNNSAVCIKTTEGNYAEMVSSFPNINGNGSFNVTVEYDSSGARTYPNTLLRPSSQNYIYNSPIWTFSNSAAYFDLDNGIIYQQMNPSSASYAIIFTGGQFNNHAQNAGKVAMLKTNGSAITSPSDCALIPDGSYNISSQGTLGTGWSNYSIICVKTVKNNLVAMTRSGNLDQSGNSSASATSMATSQVGSGIVRITAAFPVDDIYYNFDSSTASQNLSNDSQVHISLSYGYIALANGFILGQLPRDNSPSGDISSKDCSQATWFTSQQSTLGLSMNSVANFYDVYCVNLSAAHSGEPSWYGIVKVADYVKGCNYYNDSGTFCNFFDGYFLLKDPNQLTISPITVSPQFPIDNSDADLSWTTSQPTSTSLTYYFTISNLSNQVFTFNSIYIPSPQLYHTVTYSNATLTTSHDVIITNLTPESTYYAYAEGANVTGAFVFGNTASFRVSNVNASNAVGNEILQNFSDSLVVIPEDAFGNPTGISYECSWTSPDGTNSGSVPNNFNIIQDNKDYVGWTLSANIGDTWNISCWTNSIQLVPRMNASIKVSYLPFTYYLRPQPNSTNSCLIVTQGVSQQRCEDLSANSSILFPNMPNGAWYCVFNSNECPNQPNTQCSGYDGIICVNASYLPAGIIANQTQPVGTPSGTSSNQNNLGQAGCDLVTSVLTIDCNSFLFFVSMIASLIMAAAIGLVSKSGVGVGVGFVGGMIAFFALNWIPIWVPITLGVITALMIAKFGTSSVQPQGS